MSEDNLTMLVVTFAAIIYIIIHVTLWRQQEDSVD